MRVPRVTIERIASASTGRVIAVFTVALILSLALGGGLFALYGLSPQRAFELVLTRSLGIRFGWAEIARRTIPLVLVGGGIFGALRAQFWNIGADGQMLAGAAASSGLALFTPVPAPWLLPAMFVVGAAAGAVWALVPCLLRAAYGVNEIITGLMMNYVAVNGVDFLIQGPWRGRTTMGYSYTDRLPASADLPVLPGTHVHWPTALCGLALLIFLHFLLFRTRLGFQIRVLGQNPAAARYAAISSTRCFVWVALVAGGAAGLAGVGEIGGMHHRLIVPGQITVNYGFNSVIVALLAQGEPFLVLPMALLLGIVLSSGAVITVFMRLPIAVTNIFTGLILYFLAGGDILLNYRIRWFGRRAPALA